MFLEVLLVYLDMRGVAQGRKVEEHLSDLLNFNLSKISLTETWPGWWWLLLLLSKAGKGS